MTTSEALGAIIPIHELPWWQLLLVLWVLMLVIKFLLMRFEPLGWSRSYHRAGTIGDIFLAVAIVLSSQTIGSFSSDNQWFVSNAWNWTVLLVGVCTIIVIEIGFHVLIMRHLSWRQQLAPSKLWHTLLFPLVFYTAVIPLLPMLHSRQPTWVFVCAIVAYAVWFTLLIYDLFRPPDYRKTH